MKCKYIFVTVISTIIALYLAVFASAHGGKTDGSGGHYDNSTGEYHYHHGYPAHSHTGGECHYDFHDITDHSSGSSFSQKTDSEKKEKSVIQIIAGIVLCIMIAIPIFIVLFFTVGGAFTVLIENEKVLYICMAFLGIVSITISAIIIF